MKEATFIRRNRAKWEGYEKLSAKASHLSSSELSASYNDVLADLAYVRARYPDSSLLPYLNNIAKDFHEAIYFPRRKFSVRGVVDLFANEVPGIVADARREILASLIILSFFTLLGVIRTLLDVNNVVETLGQEYVDMTLRNISDGRPTDVYDMGAPADSFISILLNNVMVDLRMFGYGLIPLAGPVYFLWNNGVMLGEFNALFFMYGVGLKAMAAIWIHGTLEISALVVAGGAALALGKSWFMTGGKSVVDSLKAGGMRSLKILVSTLPLTFVAAFLEGYVTRHVEWPLAIRLSIILLSLAFVVGYYVMLPYSVYKRNTLEK